MIRSATINSRLKLTYRNNRELRLRREKVALITRELGTLFAQKLKEAGLNPNVKIHRSPNTCASYLTIQLPAPSGQPAHKVGSSIRISSLGIHITLPTWELLRDPERITRQIRNRLARKGGVK